MCIGGVTCVWVNEALAQTPAIISVSRQRPGQHYIYTLQPACSVVCVLLGQIHWSLLSVADCHAKQLANDAPARPSCHAVTTLVVLPGAVELQVMNKTWEAHLVKCCCIVIKCPPPLAAAPQQQTQQQTQQPQQQQPQPPQGPPAHTQQQQQQAAASSTQLQQPAAGAPPQLHEGDQVYVFVSSKASHSVELQAGSRVRLHPPWHIVKQQQQPGAPMVLLGHFLT